MTPHTWGPQRSLGVGNPSSAHAKACPAKAHWPRLRAHRTHDQQYPVIALLPTQQHVEWAAQLHHLSFRLARSRAQGHAHAHAARARARAARAQATNCRQDCVRHWRRWRRNPPRAGPCPWRIGKAKDSHWPASLGAKNRCSHLSHLAGYLGCPALPGNMEQYFYHLLLRPYLNLVPGKSRGIAVIELLELSDFFVYFLDFGGDLRCQGLVVEVSRDTCVDVLFRAVSTLP